MTKSNRRGRDLGVRVMNDEREPEEDEDADEEDEEDDVSGSGTDGESGDALSDEEDLIDDLYDL